MKALSIKAFVAMLSLLATFNMTSCKDDDVQPDQTQLLTGGNWKLTAFTSDPAFEWFGTPVTNIYAQLPACIKDDLTTFLNQAVLSTLTKAPANVTRTTRKPLPVPGH